MADGKRKPMILEHNAAADDEADLLVHLDEARQREHNAWNQKRCRAVRQHVAADGLEGGSESDERLDGGGATRDDQTATQIFSSALLHCRRRLQRDKAAHESLGTANATVVVREADVVEDDGDMLLHLRDERKRELNQIRQRRFRARRREELLNALRNEGTLNPLLRLRVLTNCVIRRARPPGLAIPIEIT
ncbi:hypothetical protein DVH05_008594 [Phytophthora capsici]|nr:hypothetical protein DVH05_008594 [Phytophthora capsici]